MKSWFQIVVCVGVLAISSAAITYTWQTWRTYELEKVAQAVCENLLKGGSTYERRWFLQQNCINTALGKVPAQVGQ